MSVCRSAGGTGKYSDRRIGLAVGGAARRRGCRSGGAERSRTRGGAHCWPSLAQNRPAFGNARRLAEESCMSEAAPRPLSGLKVLDFGHTIMGPCAGLLLADLGADVIKVEPKDGDATRRLPGFAAGFFAAYNRNKRSIAVDLKRPEGQAALRRLAQSADVLVENFAPGTIERLGCGWAELQRVNPRLIYLSLKGYLAGP